MKKLTSNELKEQLKLHGYIDVLWELDDIRYQAKEDGVVLTESEIKNVAVMLSRKHDANIGINWETISFWIEEIIKDRT